MFRQTKLLVLLAGAVHSLSLSTHDHSAAQAWQGTYNMTHADEILPADSAPCKQIFGADPLWSEDPVQTKCPSHISIRATCTLKLPVANIIRLPSQSFTIEAETAELWSTRNCVTCRKLLWKLPYPKDNKHTAVWLKVGERYLEPRYSCTSCKADSVLVMHSVHDRVGRCFKFIPGKEGTGYHQSFVGKKPYVVTTKMGSVITGPSPPGWVNHISRASMSATKKLLTKVILSDDILAIWSLGDGTAQKWFKDAGVIGANGCSQVTCYAQKQVQCSGATCDVRKTVKCANVCQAWTTNPKCRTDLCEGKFGHLVCKDMTSLL